MAIGIYTGHVGVGEVGAGHCKHEDMFGSVGDGKQLLLWDTRKPSSDPSSRVSGVEAHQAEVNCLAFNPFNEFVLATGSADKTVAIFDSRNLSQVRVAFSKSRHAVYLPRMERSDSKRLTTSMEGGNGVRLRKGAQLQYVRLKIRLDAECA